MEILDKTSVQVCPLLNIKGVDTTFKRVRKFKVNANQSDCMKVRSCNECLHLRNAIPHFMAVQHLLLGQAQNFSAY